MDNTYINCLALFGVGGAHPGGLHLTKTTLSKEKIDKTTKILDVGCGTGQTSAYLAKQYQCEVTALDYNEVMLEKAKNRFVSLRLPINIQHGSAEKLPFEDGSFDMVLSESVAVFTNVSKSIPEFKRVLKPGGTLIAIEMVGEQPVSKQHLRQILDFYGIPQLLSEQEWCSLFQKSSFKQIQVQSVNLQPDVNHLQHTSEFALSKQIDPKFFNIFEKHHQLIATYKHILGCRIFRCSV